MQRSTKGCGVREQSQRKEYDLAELVAQITPENLHEEIDFGWPAGKKVCFVLMRVILLHTVSGYFNPSTT